MPAGAQRRVPNISRAGASAVGAETNVVAAEALARSIGPPLDGALLEFMGGVCRLGMDPLEAVRQALNARDYFEHVDFVQLVRQTLCTMLVEGASASSAFAENGSALSQMAQAGACMHSSPAAGATPRMQRGGLTLAGAATPSIQPGPNHSAGSASPGAGPPLTHTLTLEARCAALGLDPVVALRVPPWFSSAVPAIRNVDTSAIRPPLLDYRRLLEQHVRREERQRLVSIGSASSVTQLGVAFNISTLDRVIKSAEYAMARGAMLEAWARSYLTHLFEYGASDDAANALLAEIAETARLSSSADFQRLARSTFAMAARDGKGHDGIAAVLDCTDQLLLCVDEFDSARRYADITWEVGMSALQMLQRLAELGRMLRYDDEKILGTWRSRVKAACAFAGSGNRVTTHGDQAFARQVHQSYVLMPRVQVTTVAALERCLRDDPYGHDALQRCASFDSDDDEPSEAELALQALRAAYPNMPAQWFDETGIVDDPATWDPSEF